MQEGCIRGLLHQAQTGRAYAPIVESPPCDQNLRVLELVAATLLNSTVGPGSGAEVSGCLLADTTTESCEREELQAEVNALRAQLKAAVQGAAAEKAKLLDDSAQNFATAEAAYAKQLAQQAETQREKRVAHLQQQAMRRIANAGIASGFSAWQEQWEEAARQKRMLAAAGAQLARPALAAAVAHWVGDWRVAEQAQRAARFKKAKADFAQSQLAILLE